LPLVSDSVFGLEKANLHHNRVSDLKITIQNPNGATIWLTNLNGREDGKDYTNTQFSQVGKEGMISAARAPFSGEFIPYGPVEYLIGGNNPNGTWKLLIKDLKSKEGGVLQYFVSFLIPLIKSSLIVAKWNTSECAVVATKS